MSRQYSLEEKLRAKDCARYIRETGATLEEAYDKLKVPKDHRLPAEEVEEILLSFN